MKKWLSMWLLICLLASSAVPVQARSSPEKYQWSWNNLEFSWVVPGELEGSSQTHQVSIRAEDEPDQYFLNYRIDFLTDGESSGSYVFGGDIRSSAIRLKQALRKPLDLDLVVAGESFFYPAEYSPDWAEPEPTEEVRDFMIHTDPTALLREMSNYTYRSDERKVNERLRFKTARLDVTGSIDGELFSAAGTLDLQLYWDLVKSEVPTEVLSTKAQPAKESGSGSDKLPPFKDETYMAEFTAESVRELSYEGLEYQERTQVGFTILPPGASVSLYRAGYDPVENCDYSETLEVFIDEFAFDPDDLADGRITLDASLTGELETRIYRYDSQELIIDSYPVTRQLRASFELDHYAVSRSVNRSTDGEFSIREKNLGGEYSGTAIIQVDDEDPLEGIALLSTDRIRMRAIMKTKKHSE